MMVVVGSPRATSADGSFSRSAGSVSATATAVSISTRVRSNSTSNPESFSLRKDFKKAGMCERSTRTTTIRPRGHARAATRAAINSRTDMLRIFRLDGHAVNDNEVSGRPSVRVDIEGVIRPVFLGISGCYGSRLTAGSALPISGYFPAIFQPAMITFW